MNVLTLRFTIILFTLQSATCQEFLRQLALTLLGVENVFGSNLKTSDVCSIDIQTALNKTSSGAVKEPLFLKKSGNSFELMIPNEQGDLQFQNGESATIACTSDTKPNHLTFSEYLY